MIVTRVCLLVFVVVYAAASKALYCAHGTYIHALYVSLCIPVHGQGGGEQWF